MSNIHSPERQPGESQQQYRERRAMAREAVKQITAHAINEGLTNSRQKYRDDMRKSGAMGKRIRASDALMAAWAQKRVTKAPLCDEHGAYTLVGGAYEIEGMDPTSREHVIGGGQDDGLPFYTARRKWLAGVSAQRGH